MNKIVREHYPVSSLPEDLREGLESDAKVRIVIEAENGSSVEWESLPGFKHFPEIERKPMTALEAVEAIRKFKAQGRPSIDPDEAVARIRALRDEWEDE